MTDDVPLNAAPYEHFRREIEGVREDGTLVLGEREPLDGAE